MNKPTREQIEHKAIELLLNNPSASVRWALEEAELMLSKPKYFENEKRLNDFAISLERLIQATTHVYKYIKVCNKPVSHMRFYFELDKYDSIEGVWLCAELLKYNIAYPIKELLK